jgi:hypothetical protein
MGDKGAPVTANGRRLERAAQVEAIRREVRGLWAKRSEGEALPGASDRLVAYAKAPYGGGGAIKRVFRRSFPWGSS